MTGPDLASIGIIDTMMGFPDPDPRRLYEFFRPHIKDAESKATMFPVEYLFKGNVPGAMPAELDPLEVAINTMDHFGIERSLIGVEGELGGGAAAMPSRTVSSARSRRTPTTASTRSARSAASTPSSGSVRSARSRPAATRRCRSTHARWYPIYSVCAELGIPIFICAGIPGPRLPSMCQKVELLDIVCYDFPELDVVTRHGCEPWTELAVKLMLKWPNLHYSTSAFAPKHYNQRIIDYANTRAPTRSSMPATGRWASPTNGSWATCRTCRSRTTCGRSSSASNALRVLGLATDQ